MGVRSGFVSPSRATGGGGTSAVFAGSASGHGRAKRGAKRGGPRSESVPPTRRLSPDPPYEWAKGRAALRSQGLLGIVESRRRVAALPRRVRIGRRCVRRSKRFGAASGPTLCPTTVTSLRVTTHHQCRQAGLRSHRYEGSHQLRGSEAIAPDSVRRATRGARPQGTRSRRSVFVNAGGIAALRAGLAAARPAQPLRSLPRETRSGSPLRQSVSSMARPGQHSFE
jgi:hypothetical protein